MLYLNKNEIFNLHKNKKMSGIGAEDDSEDDSETGPFSWLLNVLKGTLADNFSWFAIKEMGFYVILFIVILIAYGFLSRYNYNEDQRLLKLYQQQEKEKEKEEKSKVKAGNTRNRSR